MLIAMPNEIWRLETSQNGNEVTAVTRVNDALLAQNDMQALEPFTFKGANNEDVQGFLLKPPGFDPAKKYPLKFLIHGGPEGRGKTRGPIVGTRSCSRRTATS